MVPDTIGQTGATGSSRFPKFSRNSNTGGDFVSEKAEQYQSAVNPCSAILR
jgi:hypothetical protein